MAVLCSQCRSDLTQALTGTTYQCASCGAHFDSLTGDLMPTSNDPNPNDPGLVTGPPPKVDPEGAYDHTGPYPTPTYATPPNPEKGEGDPAPADAAAPGTAIDGDGNVVVEDQAEVEAEPDGESL